ncbi:MAG: GAF domain-containing protein [Deltaproteobacteria bacterium]|nr:GAF domain-containing protein [Deltaproteobacteria bacterium]
MRTLIVSKVNLREKFERLVTDFDVLKQLVQTQGIYIALLAQVVDRIDADDAAIFLLNAPEECLEVVLDRRPERQGFVGFKQPTNRGIVSMVLWNEHGISLANVSAHEMFDDTADRTHGYRTRAMMALPLVVHGRVVGVLSAVNKRSAPAFSDDDMNALATIASALGHVLRSQLVEKLVEL